jgi:putative permease
MFQYVARWFKKYLSDSQAIYLALLLAGGLAVVIFFGATLLPVFAAIVIAYLLDDLIDFMRRRGAPRMQAVIFVYLVFVALLMFVFFGLVPLLLGQVTAFFQELPNMISKGQEALMNLPSHYPFITEEQIGQIIATVRKELTDAGRHIVSLSLSSLAGLITIIVYLVLLPLLVFFFLKDKELILSWVRGYMPAERTLMARLWRNLDEQIGNYVRGKIWEILIVAIVTSVTFLVLGLNYAILLGALVGLSVIVPYIGAIVVTVPVILIAFFQWGWGSEFLYVAIAYGIIQTLDGAVLVPLLFSEAVNLHPIAIIVAVLFFGGLWGIWGVFFAIPLATLIQVIIMVWPRAVMDPNAGSP